MGRGIALLFSRTFGTRLGWRVSPTPRPTLPPRKTRYPLYWRVGGPQGHSVRAENLVLTGIRCLTVQPVVSVYIGWATEPRPNLPPGKTRCPLYWRVGGPQGQSVRAENLVFTGIRCLTVQPVVSVYIGWATEPRPTLPPGKTRCPLYWRVGRPQVQSVRAENLVPTGIRCLTVQPVVSPYTGWATEPKLNILHR